MKSYQTPPLFAAQITCMICLLVNWAVAQEEPPAWAETWKAARQAAIAHDFTRAVDLARQASSQGADHPLVSYHIGRWSFQAGKVADSLKSFDAYLEVAPLQSNSLWERGISCYYLGKFKLGAQQFADYQTYHDNDVENAVWRYLCQQKYDGKEKARQDILPIKHDPRVPMMEIYRLFKGEAKPEDVLVRLRRSPATGERSKVEQMHAHLYLGLYYDSEGQPKQAVSHIRQATRQFKAQQFKAQQFKAGGYMWSVAVVHEKHLLREQGNQGSE